MRYISTRGQCPSLSFTEAVETGLAPDGGLYLPETLPNIEEHLKDSTGLTYPELCYEFLKLFADDIAPAHLKEIIDASYTKFYHPEIAPLLQLEERLYVLELFHGPTLAFKDFALQLLGNLYEAQIQRTERPINILGATSGDTGSAAIHGLLGKKGVNTFILYPEGRISPLQERQMTCTGAHNVFPIAIKGTFDDAQAIIKELFNDLEFRKEHHLSAINSINLARILAQCVYYIYAWLKIPAKRQNKVQFIVPTGNFGNVFAGWLVRKMGVPIASIKVATNQNDILYRLFKSGLYEAKVVNPSVAPSMDIQAASNFERFLYYRVGEDSAKVREIMATIKETGKYTFTDFDPDILKASRAVDDEITEIIRYIHNAYNYCPDPHTACAFKELDTQFTKIVLATAHPAKFPKTIESAINITPKSDILEHLKSAEPRKQIIDAAADKVRALIEIEGVFK